MSERVPAPNKTSATPPVANQASSPLLHQNPYTSGLSESLGDNSNISKESAGIQPKTIRRSLNWQNISVEAPSRSDGRSLPGGIQRQQEEAGTVSGPVSADTAQKSALELSNSTISTEEPAQKPAIARALLNRRNIPIEAPASSAVASTYPGGIQRQETSGVKKQEESTESLQMQPEEEIQAKSSSGEPQEKEEQNQESVQTKLSVGAPGDKHEQEADSMAGKVMAMPEEAVEQPIQRQTEDEKEQLQMQPEEEIQAKSSSGEPQEKEEQNQELIQTKLSVGAPGDKHEQEADSMAGKVMARPDEAVEQPIQRQTEEEQEQLQMQPEEEIQAKSSEDEPQEKEEQNQESIQTKLTVGAPGDKYEQEADSMAAKVMTMPDSAIQQPIQRQTGEETEAVQMQPEVNSITPLVQRESGEQEEVQMKSGAGRASDGSSVASGSVEKRLAGSKGGGSPLPDDVRTFMESRFGADFSSVRVHTDSNAVQMNKELGAQAFAHGSDIYYGAGKSPGKDELTAHELTHIIQQGGAVPTKSVTGHQKKENKLQAKADAIQLTSVEAKIQRKENPQAQPAAAKVAPETPAASPSAKSEKGERANTIEKPAPGNGAGAPSTPAGNGGGAGAGASSGAGAGAPSGAGAGAGASGGGGNSPASAQNDPGFKAVVNSTKSVAAQEKNHPPAGKKSAEAQAAAVSPANEVESKAQDKQVQEMNLQQPGQFNAGAFKAALMEKISAATPQTLEEADNFKDQNKLDSVKGDLSSQVGEEKKQAANPIEEKAKEQPDTGGIGPKSVTALPPKQAGKAPSDIGADKAAPKPKSKSEVSLQVGSKSIDKQMADANITDRQLAKSNEPQFQTALESKKTAQTHANTAPNAYRQQEQGIVTQAQAQAQTTAQTQLQGMHSGREQLLTGVAGLQVDTKGKDEQKRSEVANHIQGIYNNTKHKVETALSQLDGQVNQQFDQGASAAKTEFENYVDQRMKRYKDERYSGLLGPGKWLKDKLLGMPSEVNTFYQEAKNNFLARMDKTIDNIANHVAKTLNAAKSEIAKGKQQITKYVAGLDPSLKQVGQEAAQEIQGKFDELEQSIDSKQNELIDSLAQKYNENLQQIDAQIEQMKEENKGLVQKAIDFVAGVAKTIGDLGKMLAQVLGRAIGVLPQILDNPIGFFSNLAKGVKQGLQNFMQNIVGQHLAKGLIGWLSGKVASAGVQMPESLDAKGIFTLATQIMGLTYENVRERAAKRLGDKKVSQMESSFDMFIVLKNQGMAGLWQFIQDTMGDLNQKVMEPVKSYIIESVIKAGITWIFSLLIPVSAFIKACQAIYELVMFFVERASQVVDLMNAVLDSIVAIANGAIGEAAKKIEDSLVKALPLVIDLLARVLGLGGVSQKVQGMITKVRGPIDKAIDKVIDKGAKVAGSVESKFNKSKAGKKLSSVKQFAQDKKATKDKQKDTLSADERSLEQKKAAVDKAAAEAEQILNQKNATPESVEAKLPKLESKYRLKSAKLLNSDENTYYVEVEINPKKQSGKKDLLDPKPKKQQKTKATEPAETPSSGQQSEETSQPTSKTRKRQRADSSEPSPKPGKKQKSEEKKVQQEVLNKLGYKISKIKGTVGKDLVAESSNNVKDAPNKGEICYVANVPARTNDKSPQNIAAQYVKEGFGNPEDAKRRFGLVVGVNKYESITDSNNSEGDIKAKVNTAGSWDKSRLGALGFTWQAKWQKYTGGDATLAEVKTAYSKKLTFEEKTFVSNYEKENKVIPYDGIREKVKSHEFTKKFRDELGAEGNEVYLVTGDPDAVSLKAAPSKQQGDQAESSKKGKEKEVPVQEMAEALFDRYDKIIKDNTSDEGVPPAIVSGGYEFRMTGLGGQTEDALRGAANKLDMAVRQAMAKINPNTVYFPEPNTIFRMLPAKDKRAVAGTFTSDAGGKSEGQALVASMREQRNLQKKDMVFDLNAAIETNSDRFATVIDGEKVTIKINWTGGEIPNLTEEKIKAIFESSQTHARKIYWIRRVESTYRKGRATSERSKAISDVYTHFFPNELIGYNPEELKKHLKGYTQLKGYGVLDKDTEKTLKETGEYEDVIKLAKESGKAAQELLMEILGIK